MADYGEWVTEHAVKTVNRKLKAVYNQAERELEEKLDDFNREYANKDAQKRKDIDAGKITQQEYDDWKVGQVFQQQRWENKVKSVQHVINNANEEAVRIVNDKKLDVFAENYNYAAYVAEKTVGTSFDIYNSQAVARLIKEDPKMLPSWKVDEEKDYKWNQKKVNNIIKQGIIQGESIPETTKRLCKELSTTNENKMRMFARTAMTGAENAGIMQQMKDAQKIGIRIKKQWLSTLDNRTRDAHRDLDGVTVEINKSFENEIGKIRYPGDPDADMANVCNCRCRLISVYPDYMGTVLSEGERNNKLDGQSYEEWKEGKSNKENTGQHVSVNGKDISMSWSRRKDEFDFDIEDVIDAQGFNGMPRVVSKDEFDKAVEESNFIAQRVYSAPDQETLDTYREQLYNGEWYVDCSNGGAAYGKGMYAVYSNGTEVTDYMAREMNGYASRRGIDYHYVETFTLTPDAKTITPSEIIDLKRSYYDKLMAEFNEKGGWGNPEALKWASEHDYTNMDDGSFAALMGYDAIIIHEIDDYAVILNRTKCIFLGGN